ncbi:ParB/RepB/Spo0J family partition protein [Succinimonas amylolytica]|uniref:ParB/RepB/Spo0J family partition protein n=1 Tax=Succinimonas amylolytica TaxID=83769 RepID=UPI000360ECF6|nr:ParB/RepB/Spo0J family partition protein [Succinimonas amylolytica]
MNVIEIPLSEIQEDENQPRSASNEGFSSQSLAELADSIRQVGVKSPISVREVSGKPYKYVINFGARRFRAARIACLTTIPAYIDNEQGSIAQLLENIQRQNLTCLEMANVVRRLKDGGLTDSEVAKKLSMSSGAVSNLLQVLEMPPIIRSAYDLKLVSNHNAHVVALLVGLHRNYGKYFEDWFEQALQQGKVDYSVVQTGRKYLQTVARKDNNAQKRKEQRITSASVSDDLQNNNSSSSMNKPKTVVNRQGVAGTVLAYQVRTSSGDIVVWDIDSVQGGQV